MNGRKWKKRNCSHVNMVSLLVQDECYCEIVEPLETYLDDDDEEVDVVDRPVGDVDDVDELRERRSQLCNSSNIRHDCLYRI